MPKKITSKIFIEKAKAVHNNLYDYSNVKYINSSTKVCIIHPEYGSFWQEPNAHLKGQGYPKFKNNSNSAKLSFIIKAKKLYGNRYDYSKVVYIDSKTPVCILEPGYGEFFETPSEHIRIKRQRKNYNAKNIFLEKAVELHGNLYNYNNIEYINSKTKIEIICKKHGSFYQTPNTHISDGGSGCPICKFSHGERIIYKTLNNMDIKFEMQKGFKDLKYKKSLKYDFYINKHNLLIEYDGKHHFEEVHGDLKLIQKRDKIKDNYAIDNNIKLIRIPYWEKDNLKDIIENINKESK